MFIFEFIIEFIQSEDFWVILIGGFIIGFLFYQMLSGIILGILSTTYAVISYVFEKIFKFLSFVFIQSYMIIMFNIDSKKRGYDISEFWLQRKITVNGIFSKDVTGVEVLTIQHPKYLLNLIKFFMKFNRKLSNLLIFLKIKR